MYYPDNTPVCPINNGQQILAALLEGPEAHGYETPFMDAFAHHRSDQDADRYCVSSGHVCI